MIRRTTALWTLTAAAGFAVAIAAAQPQGPGQGKPAPAHQPGGHDAGDHHGMHQMKPAQDDREFAAMMAEHHTSAIEMARFAAAHGQQAEVKQLAQHIHEEQTREQLDLERRALSAGGPAHMIDPEMQKRSQSMVDELHTAKPADIDRVFLANMAMHHQDGIEMARGSLGNLKDQSLRSMAQKSMADQSQEVEQMRGMGGAGGRDADHRQDHDKK